MAMLLAPYNDAMRLGMGFNSFTQQLCINDAVRLEGGGRTPATERNLRPQYKFGQMTGVDGGNVDISQDVTWTAKFVDRISEITDSLNVSGSLQIKCDAVGGGGKASASFIDTNKFKESDINYFIQVRVTNQRLTAPDLTDFDPIQYLPASEFNRVYGDSFISGFTEGGEFNALISIKLKDRSKAKEIKGDLEVNMNFTAVSVSGKGALAKTDASKEMQGETTIAVSWKGGGDIKDATVMDWTLESLKSVAMEFPEHVMACPMRTNAILTKYTSLKSFYQKSIKGSPLDYENAGVYSSALLDAYMDYKVMWRNIQQARQSTLVAKEHVEEFNELKGEAKANFDAQMVVYKKKVAEFELKRGSNLLTGNPACVSPPPIVPPAVPVATPPAVDSTGAVAVSSVSQPVPPAAQPLSPPVVQPTAPVAQPAAPVVPYSPPALAELEAAEPLPPNDLTPYRGSLFGLDKARRDCRFEMIKIVREVDAVADDPKVACDPMRSWQYLSPAVFRMLLPTVRNFDRERAAEQASEAAKKAKAEKEAHQLAMATNLTASKDKVTLLEGQSKELQSTKEELEKQLEELQKAHETLKKTYDALKQGLNPWDGWAPVTVRTYVRIRSMWTKKCLDYFYSDGNGSLELFQHEANTGHNQRFQINAVGPRAFSIKHVTSGHFVTTGKKVSYGVYFTMGECPSFFTFEAMNDKDGKWTGACMVHIAEMPDHTFNVEGGASHDGAKIIGWNGSPKSDNDKWYIKDFDDLSI
ncbi:unnamed protein product [Mycena citricolor]|uniref:Uncharacterized protein n=1 Tax=Mycena citricolor TaxID=2018698 RepID=A0AAD2HDL1_9AGAR|nr:unnamed protein product [Mycena citricolor]